MFPEGHAGANDFGERLPFGIGSVQINADEIIFSSDGFGGDSFDGNDYYGYAIKLNRVIIGVVLRRIMCFQRLELWTSAIQSLSMEVGTSRIGSCLIKAD